MWFSDPSEEWDVVFVGLVGLVGLVRLAAAVAAVAAASPVLAPGWVFPPWQALVPAVEIVAHWDWAPLPGPGCFAAPRCVAWPSPGTQCSPAAVGSLRGGDGPRLAHLRFAGNPAAKHAEKVRSAPTTCGACPDHNVHSTPDRLLRAKLGGLKISSHPPPLERLLAGSRPRPRHGCGSCAGTGIETSGHLAAAAAPGTSEGRNLRSPWPRDHSPGEEKN